MNPDGFVYKEGGGNTNDGSDPRTYGYNWWNYYASGNGTNRFTSIKDLTVQADVRSSSYTTSYSYLASDISVTNNIITGFSDFTTYKNLKVPATNNVFINHNGILVLNKAHSNPEGSGLNKYVGGIQETGTAYYASVASFNGFVDPTNLNFKLTPQGLNKIRQTLPSFQDIPFQDIPTL